MGEGWLTGWWWWWVALLRHVDVARVVVRSLSSQRMCGWVGVWECGWVMVEWEGRWREMACGGCGGIAVHRGGVCACSTVGVE